MPTKNNPFEFAARRASVDSDLKIVRDLEREFGLTKPEAQSVWLCCPEFQERFCRQHIFRRKLRSASEHGSKAWLKRRFDLSEVELEPVFNQIWNGDGVSESSEFLKIVGLNRIARSQLTVEAQDLMRQLQQQFFAND